MDNSELDRIRELISGLSKSEQDKLFLNLKRVTFNFRVQPSFLNYSSHPLTIPREYYSYLDIHKISAKKDTTVELPDGSTAVGYIYHGSTTQRGNYRQIKIRNPHTGGGLAMINVGDVLKVEIYKEDGTARINISKLPR
jgi:hypothetical protein